MSVTHVGTNKELKKHKISLTLNLLITNYANSFPFLHVPSARKLGYRHVHMTSKEEGIGEENRR